MSDLGLVQKTVAVMSCVAANPTGIGLSDVARTCGLPKATCYRVLTTLESEGWLESDETTRKFRVSIGFLLMTQQHSGPESTTHFIKSMLRELSASVRETAGLDKLSGDSVMVLAEVQGPYLISHGPRVVPRLLPSWRTSTGKVLLAWGGPMPSREVVERDLTDNPSPNLTSWHDLQTELEAVRDRGYATAFDELEVGLAAVAAPVHIGDSVPYSVWISGPAFRMPQTDLDRFALDAIAAASKLSSLLSREGSGATGVVEVPAMGLIAPE